jgi:hypothetical protein
MVSTLQVLTSLVNQTGPALYSGPEDWILDQRKVGGGAFNEFLRTHSMKDMLSGGEKIQDFIFLENIVNHGAYDPLEGQEYNLSETGQKITVDWRFRRGYITWLEQEYLLNGLSQGLVTRKGMFHKFKDEQRRKEIVFWESAIADWRSMMWRVPNQNEMGEVSSSSTPIQWLSIPCFVNEDTNGLAAPGATNGGTWTTVQGVNPVTYSKWKPTQKTYSNLTVDDPSNLIFGLRKAMQDTEFETAVLMPETFDSEMFPSQGFVLTSSQGELNAMQLWQASNMEWEDKNDPLNRPRFAGMKIQRDPELDTAAIYPTGAAAAYSTELDTAGTNNAGPRYVGLQPKYARLVFHESKFMERGMPMTDRAQPNAVSINYDTYGNLFFRSRRRHFIVYPNADVV